MKLVGELNAHMTRPASLEQHLTALDTRRGKNRVAAVIAWCAEHNSFDVLLGKVAASTPRRRGSLSWVLARAVTEKLWSPSASQREHIVSLLEKEREDAMTKRSLLDIFQYAPLPSKQLGTLTDVSIRMLRDPKETTAVVAFAITVLFRIMKKYPELYGEVEDLMHELCRHERLAIRLRAGKAVKMMEGMQE